MKYTYLQIESARNELINKFSSLETKSDILRDAKLKSLFDEIKVIPPEERANFGLQINSLRQEFEELIKKYQDDNVEIVPLDITAPYDKNTPNNLKNELLPSQFGTINPLTQEISIILDIFYRMGFSAVESREIDDDYHMFGSLNFPDEHPARDDYDTFLTVQTDDNSKPFIAPAHTSTMQNRILKSLKANLKEGHPIAVVIPGRVFRNEDLDARHEHTFYQLEGIYIDKDVHAGNLIATLKTFLQTYFNKDLEVKTNPFYFPFTEPSFEFSLSCPFCDKKGCQICSQSGWIELLGCGMVHPNVLRHADIDSEKYTGFAWGCGIERLVMMKYGIEDIRYFQSGKLDFLRQFK